ncbi:MAG: hypothetical protein LBR90_02920 [Elusimicrobiota bacterium]|jgi:hypothetical protein|nr:hypothetical protein [Elusimicrobiota bacterium]
MDKKKNFIFYTEIFVACAMVALMLWGAGYKLSYMKARAAGETTAKNRAVLEGAIAVYRGYNEGRCPAALEDLLKDHLEAIPPSYSRGGAHKSARAVNAPSYEQGFDGQGGWVYVNNPADEDFCSVFTNIF